MQVKKNCKNCKKIFLDYSSGHRKYCSRKCYAENLSKEKLGKPNKYAIKGFKRNPEEFTLERRKRMSLVMKERHKKEEIGFQRGQKHWAWNGGISSLRHRIHSSFLYRQWRSDCFIRDDYTCQICFVRGGILNVDHYPKLFSEIIKEYKIKTLEDADKCEELWNINNGRTLCKSCHLKFGKNPRNTI